MKNKHDVVYMYAYLYNKISADIKTGYANSPRLTTSRLSVAPLAYIINKPT